MFKYKKTKKQTKNQKQPFQTLKKKMNLRKAAEPHICQKQTNKLQIGLKRTQKPMRATLSALNSRTFHSKNTHMRQLSYHSLQLYRECVIASFGGAVAKVQQGA